MSIIRTVVMICILLTLSLSGLGCTTFGVTKSASVDGSVFVGHSNDGFGPSDVGGIIREDMIAFRYITAQNHTPGSKRPIPYDPNSGGEFRGEASTSTGNETIIGYIDQVEHTFGYLTGSYGIINEHQLMSGECTDFAKIHPDAEEGKRIFYSSELSNIAMERCKTAREAINLTGYLIDEYGYYGTGETLIFGDPTEVWVMEMCGGTPSGTGGYWVAQKVPDGEVFVAANQFRIREIDPRNSDKIYSKNLFKDAEAMGWWSPSDGKLDWAKVFGAGEYSHPYYSLGRVWSILDRIAPSLNLSPYVEGPFTSEYPFSVAPDKPINITEAFGLFRDHYEGTVFDLTAPPAGGPFGNPYRNWGPFDKHDRLYSEELKPGAWARPISTDPCGYSYVAQARDWLPDEIGGICWLGLSSPSETCYAPFYAGITKLPAPYLNGSHWDLDMDTAFWPFEMVQNWARPMYGEMIPIIKEEQASLEGAALSRQADIEHKALDLYKEDELAAGAYLTEYTNETSMENLDSWKALFERLVVTYRNGQYNDIQNKTIQNIGYPEWWLENARYQYGPRVYDLESLRQISDVKYVGETVNVTSEDMIGYIREHQTG
jgi:dipeptidase